MIEEDVVDAEVTVPDRVVMRTVQRALRITLGHRDGMDVITRLDVTKIPGLQDAWSLVVGGVAIPMPPELDYYVFPGDGLPAAEMMHQELMVEGVSSVRLVGYVFTRNEDRLRMTAAQEPVRFRVGDKLFRRRRGGTFTLDE